MSVDTRKFGSLALASMLLVCAPAWAQEEVLSKLVPARVGSNACFKAEYDKAHLAAHPKQTSRSVLLSLQYEISEAGNGGRFVRIAIARGAPAEKLYMVGDLFSGLPSDQEGGDILVQFAPDARTAMLYLPGGVAAWRGADQSNKAVSIQLGADDRVFRLRSVYPENCSPLAALRVK
jgi:hypothetical protein